MQVVSVCFIPAEHAVGSFDPFGQNVPRGHCPPVVEFGQKQVEAFCVVFPVQVRLPMSIGRAEEAPLRQNQPAAQSANDALKPDVGQYLPASHGTQSCSVIFLPNEL